MLYLDRETWNELDLTEVGTFVYAESAQDLLLAYAVDDRPANVWDCTDGSRMPSELEDAMHQEAEVWAHNAMFDREVHYGPFQAHLPYIAPNRWRCSMALALSHALPGKLSQLCEVLDVPEDQSKLKEGGKLLRLFTRPLPSNRKLRRATRETHPAEWERFKLYAKNDIVAMRECMRRIPRWNWDALAVEEWLADQRCNARGFQVDTELVEAAVRVSRAEQDRLGVRFRELTRGTVTKPTQRAQFLAFLNAEYRMGIDNTRSDTFVQIIKQQKLTGATNTGVKLPPEAIEIMELSIAANKTSTAKFAALAPATMSDGRFRGALQFAGAGRTRRWAGRLFQAHNLPARALPPAWQVEQFIEAVKLFVSDLYTNETMRLASAALRGVVIAKPGHKLVIADLSNIEGRLLSWYAREEWKLKAFRDFDTIIGTDVTGKPLRKGPDLYNVTAVSIVGGDAWNVDKDTRQAFGKVPDLASGYQGGVAGYQKFAKAYQVRMADHWVTMQKTLAPHVLAKAQANLQKYGHQQCEEMEISTTEWLASESCKLAWRDRHPATCRLWYNLQEAFENAITHPGDVFAVGPYLKLRVVKYKGFNWLCLRLPNGRMLTYRDPHIMRDGGLAYFGEAAEEGKTTRQWIRVFTHGGKITGNICQTTGRDILSPALLRAEAADYLPVLSVHDEAVTEVPDEDRYTADALVHILAQGEDWAPGLPLAAAGFETYRYHKE
jgi:DNA polymerase